MPQETFTNLAILSIEAETPTQIEFSQWVINDYNLCVWES